MFKNSNFFLDVSFQNDWWFGLSPDCPHGKKSYLKLNSFRTKRCCSVRTVWCLLFKLQRNSQQNFFLKHEIFGGAVATAYKSALHLESAPSFEWVHHNAFLVSKTVFSSNGQRFGLGRTLQHWMTKVWTPRGGARSPHGLQKQFGECVRLNNTMFINNHQPKLSFKILINFMIKIDLSFEASGNGRTASLHLQKPSREVG